MSGYRPAYTPEEQQKIVQYIIDHKGEYSLRGNSFWKEMVGSGGFNRTWQSLKEHFRKQIYPLIHRMDGFEKEDLLRIKHGYESSQQNSTNKINPTDWPYNLQDTYE